ncbi:MAG TPA: TonB-dependent receptor, partial [Bacteroidota bacterium]|nr:TonB-dependent receptor [Bacteroidota bacterium]
MKIHHVMIGGTLLALCATLTFSEEKSDSIKYHFPIVTTVGTRYAEPWILAPLALEYLQQKDLPRGKGYGLDEVLSAVPGVLVQSRFGNQDVRIAIRGFGARGAGERSNAGTSRGVRILSNGFPDTEPDGRTSFDLTDIAGAGAIEVMRSNASSIYGNASGGIINILSNTMFESPFAAYTESFGSFGFRKESIRAGARLGTGKMYLSMSNTNSNGWRYQSRSTQSLLNTGIAAQAGERTQLGIHISATSNLFRIPGPLSQNQYDSLAQQADSTYIRRDERRFNRIGRIGVTAAHDIDDHNTITASAFIQPKMIQRSERNTYRDFNRYHLGGSIIYRNRTSFSASVLNTVLAGTDEAYQDGAILFYSLTPQNGRGILTDNKREGANNFGVFLQDEIELNEKAVVLLGGRYDDITYYSEGYFAPPTARKNETKSFSHVTPKAGFLYRLSPNASVYANIGGGIEVPAGNETDPSGTVPGDSVFAINPLLEPI